MDILAAIPFPAPDPVAIQLGPFAIRWYALSYITGLVLGWLYIRAISGGARGVMTKREVDDLLLWATLGVVLGGRTGYVLFYKPGYYVFHPLEAFYLWRGGMSFHGGLLGVITVVVLFPYLRKLRVLRRVRTHKPPRPERVARVKAFGVYARGRLNPFAIGDLVACAAPIGLFFGRLANFINGELWGRPSDLPWAMIFPDPRSGGIPRHPSQLYEATLEGLVLGTVLFLLWRFTGARRRPGELGGWFLIGYGLARITGELFREPDPQLGFLLAGTTMGQLLSLPMIIAGIWLVRRARRKAAGARAPKP